MFCRVLTFLSSRILKLVKKKFRIRGTVLLFAHTPNLIFKMKYQRFHENSILGKPIVRLNRVEDESVAHPLGPFHLKSRYLEV